MQLQAQIIESRLLFGLGQNQVTQPVLAQGNGRKPHLVLMMLNFNFSIVYSLPSFPSYLFK